MRSNRKRESLRFGNVAKSLFTCLAIATVGVGYVWQKNQIYRTGDEIKKRETALSACNNDSRYASRTSYKPLPKNCSHGSRF